MAPDPKKSLTKFSSLCDEKVMKAIKFLDINKDGLTARTMSVAEAHAQAVEDQFSKMEKKWQDDFMVEVMDRDDDDKLYNELSSMVKVTSAKVDECVEKLDKILKEYDSGTGAALATLVPKAMKLDNSFKPDTSLTFENTLEEFNAWQRSFVAHYDSNKEYLRAATPEIRRQFLNNCIDSKLQAALITDDTITMATTIDGNDGLVAKLKAYILRDLPLFIRRYHYSKCQQRPKESFGDWWTRKLLKAAECDLEKVKKDDIQVTELICGITDPKLRDEILKIREPKLADLVAMGHRFDTAAKLQKNDFNEDITQVNKVQSDYRRSKNNDWQKGREMDQAKCQHCGQTHDTDKACWAKGLKCLSCGEKGHVRAACPKQTKTMNSTKAVDSKTVKVSRVRIDQEDLDGVDELDRKKLVKILKTVGVHDEVRSSHPHGGKEDGGEWRPFLGEPERR